MQLYYFLALVIDPAEAENITATLKEHKQVKYVGSGEDFILVYMNEETNGKAIKEFAEMVVGKMVGVKSVSVPARNIPSYSLLGF